MTMNNAKPNDRSDVITALASAIEKHFEKHIHMARRPYPEVWKRDVAEVALTAYESMAKREDAAPELPTYFSPLPLLGTVEGSVCSAGAPKLNRSSLAAVLHEKIFGLDDWGAANTQERDEMLDHADTIIASLGSTDDREAILQENRARARVAANTIAVLHEPKKFWESDRSYTLICRTCNMPAPCPTLELARSIPDRIN